MTYQIGKKWDQLNFYHSLKKPCQVCLLTFSPCHRRLGKVKSLTVFFFLVDRLSGWIVGIPTTKQGLTAKNAANLLLDHCWDFFGIPTLITSDQGPQFISQWWQTMCSRLGIRHAYSQAHHPRAHGRAERAGQSIIELLKKMNVDKKLTGLKLYPEFSINSMTPLTKLDIPHTK